MTETLTRQDFLALCASEDFAMIGRVLMAQPAWLTTVDAEVAAAVWQATWRGYSLVRRMQTDLAAREAAQARAEDDLDVFQAGYERGYAQGWQHRGEHDGAPQKAPLPA